jgi:hypothetical protein
VKSIGKHLSFKITQINSMFHWVNNETCSVSGNIVELKKYRKITSGPLSRTIKSPFSFYTSHIFGLTSIHRVKEQKITPCLSKRHTQQLMFLFKALHNSHILMIIYVDIIAQYRSHTMHFQGEMSVAVTTMIVHLHLVRAATLFPISKLPCYSPRIFPLGLIQWLRGE